jgi:hypothetical protein
VTEFQLQVLREIAGELPVSLWDEEFGNAVSSLKSAGYLNKQGWITTEGRQTLESNRLTTDCNARAESSGDRCELEAGHEGNHACPRTLASYQKRYIERSKK